MDRLSQSAAKATKALPSIAAQAITAGTSLLLQVVAFFELGLSTYGVFAIFLGLLVSVTACYTGFVGDSLAVLDRHDPTCRAALMTSAVTGWSLGAGLGMVMALLIGPADMATMLMFPALMVCWLARETLRRLLVARLEFGRLVVNDACYLLTTVVGLVGVAALGDLGLADLFGVMATGSLVTVLVGRWQVPRTELRHLRFGFAGLPALTTFAAWRALQSGLRPLTLLVARLLLAGFASLAAVGLLEAARLVVAPLQVVVNGSGNFLLGTFAERERTGKGRNKLARYATSILVAVVVVCGCVLAALVGYFAETLAGQGVLIGQGVLTLAVLGWVGYLAVWAAGLPFGSELVAQRRSRTVFLIRLSDSAVGLGAVVLALALGAGAAAVPWLLATTGLYPVWLLRRLARAGHEDISRATSPSRVPG